MKKIMMLFLLVSFMCFGEDKVEPKKSYEVIQREEIDFLKTQLIKSNNKIDNLSKKIEELEDKGEKNLGLTYNVDQIYQNSVQYYDKTVKFIILLITGVGTILAILLGLLSGFNNKKLKEERAEIREDAKDLRKEVKEIMKEKKEEITKELDKRVERMWKENTELKEKIAEQEKEVERKTLELDEKIEQTTKEMSKKLKEVEYNTELAIAINKSKDEEKIKELKKLTEKYPEKAQIYVELGSSLVNGKNYEEAILKFKILKGLEYEDYRRYGFIGFAYELWADSEKEENAIEAKKHFEKAIKNYKEAIELSLDDEVSIAIKERLEETEEELKKLEELEKFEEEIKKS